MGEQDSFMHMVFADLLITSRSSFSYKPALMSNESLRKQMGVARKKKYEQGFTLSIFENHIVDILNGMCIISHQSQ